MGNGHQECGRGAALCVAMLLLGSALSFTAQAKNAAAAKWVGSWAASQQIPEPRNAVNAADLLDATLREIVHLSAGGSELRVRLSNAFGTEPLQIDSVHIARPRSLETGETDPSTDRALTFSGRPDLTIPAGAEYLSDPIAFEAAPLSDLAITLYLETPPAQETSHPGSRETSFLVHGDQVSAAALPDAKRFDHWFFISGVDVEAAPPGAAAIVALGDSITDGHASMTNGNDRWPDDLARRLRASANMQSLSVLNAGIGGNRLLLDGLGPNALARFNRDVLAQAGVRYVIVLEGINDLGTLDREHEVPSAKHQELVRNIIGAYKQIILRAHAAGLKVIGGTIMPDGGSLYYHPTAVDNADRRAINQWIRTPGHFDAVIDFDKTMRDPADPDRLLPAYDSGDHLHPSPAGYRAMAGAIPLSDFTE
jgi:lysophospholipase L1-like esterase